MSFAIRVVAVTLSCLGNADHVCEEWYREAALFVRLDSSLDSEALLTYFSTCTPSAKELNEIPIWLNRLGDDNFQIREQASRQLLRLGRAALPSLQEGLASKDAEVRRRCAECLDKMESLKFHLEERLIILSRAKTAYCVQVSFLRRMEKSCYGKISQVREAQQLAIECDADLERVEWMLLRIGIGREEVDKCKREAEQEDRP
jgi:hypothetical protein